MSKLAVVHGPLAPVDLVVLENAGFLVTTSPTSSTFFCQPGETLLRAGLAAGLAMPYECASGSCGTCRVRLLQGEVDCLWPQASGLSERDRAKGDRILCCQSVALSACTIQIQPGPNMTQSRVPRQWSAEVQERRSLNKNVQHITLRIDSANFGDQEFLAGQFMLFELGPGIGRRAYSMANMPNGTGCLEFVIKVKPGGSASPVLFALEVGAKIQLEGPYGQAYFRAGSDRPLVAIAGGSGLGPMLSIIQAALAHGGDSMVQLFFGVNEGDDLFFNEEISALEQRYESLRVHRVVLHPKSSDPPDFQTGTVGDAALRIVGNLSDYDVYMAGPPAMINAVLKDTVLAGHALAERVFFDSFN